MASEPFQHRRILRDIKVKVEGSQPIRRVYYADVPDNRMPTVHQLVLMEKTEELNLWLNQHPRDIEKCYRFKTPLLLAVKHDCYSCVQILLNHNANVEETNMYEETALIYAVKSHNGTIMQALLGHKANIRATNRNNDTVTDIALSEDNVLLLNAIHMHNNHLLEPDRRTRTFPLAAAIRFQARRVLITY